MMERPPSSSGAKRRRSEASEQGSKRQRNIPGKNSPAATDREAASEDSRKLAKPTQKAEDPRESRRKSGVTDEKQRSKRLFGALLGNLNRPTGDRTSKRRAEIEDRRKAELQKQDDERIEDRQRRLERLAIQRKKEQINVDEQGMHTRHKNLLNVANFLQTRVEPKLYYRPWELLPDEEDRIEAQILDAQAQVDRELAGFQEAKQKRLEEINGSKEHKPASTTDGDDNPKESAPIQVGASEDNGANGDADKEEQVAPTNKPDEIPRPAEVPDSQPNEPDVDGTPTICAPAESSTGPSMAAATDEAKEPEAGQGEELDADDDGDHVVEGNDEDAVIY